MEGIASDDLRVALATFDGLGTFESLLLADQQKFVRWIAKALGEASYWSRIDALVMAMRVAPMFPEKDSILADGVEVP